MNKIIIKTKSIKNAPVKCSYCKRKQAYKTAHGYGYYGVTICDDCLKIENAKEIKMRKQEENETYSEADYATWLRI